MKDGNLLEDEENPCATVGRCGGDTRYNYEECFLFFCMCHDYAECFDKDGFWVEEITVPCEPRFC